MPTIESLYAALQDAFDFYNSRPVLLDDRLPKASITLRARNKSSGFYRRHSFRGKDNTKINSQVYSHEIALNLDRFAGRSDEEILADLLHQMVHCEQHVCADPPAKAGYHDSWFIGRMLELGLRPAAKGRQTGYKVEQIIIIGGPYQKAYQQLAATGFNLQWQPGVALPKKKTSGGRRIKFSCPKCSLNAWARATAKLLCGACSTEHTLVALVEAVPEPVAVSWDEDLRRGRWRRLISKAGQRSNH